MDDRDPPVSVREHPRGRELRVGMVCASVRIHDTPLTGGYWDMLALPLARLRPAPRCLLLGLGGGSAARLLRAIDADAHIVAVELSPIVVEVARSEFGLDALGLEIAVTDALEFLRHDTDAYDLVIEDIFVDRLGVACKPEWLPEPGLALAAARMRDGGILVSNNLSEADASARVLRRLFEHVVCVEVPDSDNRVYLASHGQLDPDTLRQATERHELLRQATAASGRMSKL